MMTLLLTFFSASILSADQNPWTGKWHVFWKHGAIILTMEQHGDDVNGSYTPNNGTIVGTIKNNKLYAITKNPDGQGKIIVTMGRNGNSLFGNNIYGEWITGIRADADNEFNTLLIDDSSPIRVFYSFVKLGNQVRAGHYEAMEKTLNLLHLEEEQQRLLYGKRLLLSRMFFNILEACTVDKYAFKLNVSEDQDSVLLRQSGTTNTVKVEFVKASQTEGWARPILLKLNL
jgi:hypothetical protein